jgi:hypothetical protein
MYLLQSHKLKIPDTECKTRAVIAPVLFGQNWALLNILTHRLDYVQLHLTLPNLAQQNLAYRSPFSASVSVCMAQQFFNTNAYRKNPKNLNSLPGGIPYRKVWKI